MASQATFYGVPLRLISLVILVVQNSALTILLHYVRFHSVWWLTLQLVS